MLQNIAGFEVNLQRVRFAEDGGVDSNDYIAMTFQSDKNPEFQGKTLVIGNFQEQEGSDNLAFEAYFYGEPNVDELVSKYPDDINLIAVDIITKSVENASNVIEENNNEKLDQ